MVKKTGSSIVLYLIYLKYQEEKSINTAPYIPLYAGMDVINDEFLYKSGLGRENCTVYKFPGEQNHSD